MADKKLQPNESSPGGDRFKSDTQKVVQRHLEDKDHVISDEDIRNVRIGMTPPVSDRHGIDETIKEIESAKDETENKEQKPSDDPITPWDTLAH